MKNVHHFNESSTKSTDHTSLIHEYEIYSTFSLCQGENRL